MSIQVVASFCTGSLRLLWMFRLSLITTLMLLLTKEWMTLGVSRVSMEILIQLVGKTPGLSFKLWATAPRCLGCVWVTSMKFCLRMRNRVGWIDWRDKCRVSGMLWITASWRILVLMGNLSLGATVDQVTKTLGFFWIGVWQLQSGFYVSLLLEYIILKPSIQTINHSCFAQILNLFYRKGKPFRFELMWLKDISCEAVIKDS